MLYRFDDCELDLRQHEFRRGGEVVPLEPQVFDLLALFVTRAGDLVDRDSMIEEIWGGRIVSEAAISSRINAVRRAIGDDGRAQHLLKTVPRRGFRFVGEVSEAADAPRAQQGEETQKIRMTRSRDGARIAFTTTGSGPPLMRAGHFLTNLELDWKSPIWRPLLSRLGERFSVTRYDQRSTGLSDPAPKSLALDRLAEDLEAVADAAGLDRFPIFATSQGVPVAVAFAARHPERVSGLVLYGGYAQGRSVRGTEEETRNAEAITTILRQGWGRSGSAFATAFAALYMPDATHEQLQHVSEMQLASATPENAVALRLAIDSFDVTELMGSVRAPTLILHAREDAVHPAAQSGVLAAGIPGAQLHVMESRNHIPLPQDPCWSELIEAAVGFLDA
ncbi:alpha/beta fold hydrolase [Ostreiculturibacter nitratireducens]|uniref:alpha/beta fold hydrolase n=1 Tax=Ostreiculturibacter nitratireducens TaxID=3075226 RepID=UPI0031B5814B